MYESLDTNRNNVDEKCFAFCWYVIIIMIIIVSHYCVFS